MTSSFVVLSCRAMLLLPGIMLGCLAVMASWCAMFFFVALIINGVLTLWQMTCIARQWHVHFALPCTLCCTVVTRSRHSCLVSSARHTQYGLCPVLQGSIP